LHNTHVRRWRLWSQIAGSGLTASAQRRGEL